MKKIYHFLIFMFLVSCNSHVDECSVNHAVELKTFSQKEKALVRECYPVLIETVPNIESYFIHSIKEVDDSIVVVSLFPLRSLQSYELKIGGVVYGQMGFDGDISVEIKKSSFKK